MGRKYWFRVWVSVQFRVILEILFSWYEMKIQNIQQRATFLFIIFKSVLRLLFDRKHNAPYFAWLTGNFKREHWQREETFSFQGALWLTWPQHRCNWNHFTVVQPFVHIIPMLACEIISAVLEKFSKLISERIYTNIVKFFALRISDNRVTSERIWIHLFAFLLIYILNWLFELDWFTSRVKGRKWGATFPTTWAQSCGIRLHKSGRASATQISDNALKSEGFLLLCAVKTV